MLFFCRSASAGRITQFEIVNGAGPLEHERTDWADEHEWGRDRAMDDYVTLIRIWCEANEQMEEYADANPFAELSDDSDDLDYSDEESDDDDRYGHEEGMGVEAPLQTGTIFDDEVEESEDELLMPIASPLIGDLILTTTVQTVAPTAEQQPEVMGTTDSLSVEEAAASQTEDGEGEEINHGNPALVPTSAPEPIASNLLSALYAAPVIAPSNRASSSSLPARPYGPAVPRSTSALSMHALPPRPTAAPSGNFS